MERRHVSLVGPTLLVGLGIILLLNNLGVLSWGISEMLRLWPVLLIAAGLEELLGRRSLWGSIIAAVLVLALVLGSIWFMGSVSRGVGTGETVSIAYPLDDAESAEVRLEPAVANVTVGTLVDSANLVEGTLELRSDEGLDRRFTPGDRAELLLASEDLGPLGFTGLGQYSSWTLDLSPEVDVELAVDLGVGEAELNLSDLNVTDLMADFGVGQLEIVLPDETSTTVNIDGGIGLVRVNVPPELGIRVVADAALVGRTFPPGYERSGDVYTSPNYERADYRTTINIGLGIGSITVRER